MGYKHIENLYRNKRILEFKECYALEKIHGTSAHVRITRAEEAKDVEFVTPDQVIITFFSGGASHEHFVSLFDIEKLKTKFLELGLDDIVIYGEAYGGKCQKMSDTYGKDLKFVVFEVQIKDRWMNVPTAERFINQFGLEFVHYNRIECTLEAINAERDADSVQAIRNGMGAGHVREGVVLRPITEYVHQGENGGVIRVKHKRDEFRETKTPREVILDPTRLKCLEDANKIADEWVTPMRLQHVLDKLEQPINIGDLIKAMLEDVERESEGEIIKSKVARTAITKKTVKLYKKN